MKADRILYILLYTHFITQTIFLSLSCYLISSFFPSLPISSIGFYSGTIIGIQHLSTGLSSLWIQPSSVSKRGILKRIGVQMICLFFLWNSYSYLSLLVWKGIMGCNGMIPFLEMHARKEQNMQKISHVLWSIALLTTCALICIFNVLEYSIQKQYQMGMLILLILNGMTFVLVLQWKERTHVVLIQDEYAEEEVHEMEEFGLKEEQVNEVKVRDDWNKHLKMDTNQQVRFKEMLVWIPHHVHQSSASGHVVLYECIGDIQCSSLFANVDKDELVGHYAHWMDFIMTKYIDVMNRTEQKERLIVIVDLQGLNINDARGSAQKCVLAILEMLQLRFPAMLYRMILINEPFWFHLVWSRIVTKIDPKTQTKIECIPDRTEYGHRLCNLIGEEALPVRYGGQNVVELGQSKESSLLEEYLQKNTTVDNVKTTSYVAIKHENSDEEDDFFDCQEIEEIKGVIPEQQQRQRPSSPTSSSQHGISIQDLEKGQTSIDVKETSPLKEVTSSDEQPASTRLLEGSTSNSAGPLTMAYGLWSCSMASFDELYAPWLFSFGNIKEYTFFSISISGSLLITAISLIILHILLRTQMQKCSCRRLRLVLLSQCLCFLAFPHIGKVPYDIQWILVPMSLVIKHSLSYMGTQSMSSMIEAKHGITPSRTASFVAHFAKGIGCILMPFVLALVLQLELAPPLDKTFPYTLLAMIQLIVLMSTIWFPVYVSSKFNRVA